MGGGCPGKTRNDYELELHRSMYSFLAAIGKGGFGRVWKVQLKKTRQTYALKIMSKARIITKRSVQSVMNQKTFLQSIQNPFIINMVASFQDRQNLYLVMDYLSGGDLRYYINRKTRFSQSQIKFLIRCIMEGLKYLHDMNIIHRDIKPENIVFEETGYCRITDLGVAREWRSDNSSQTSGTPGYMAPEVMCRSNHSFCADYFAVGVICFELMMGYRPYQGSTRKAIRDQILAKQVEIPKHCMSFSKDLIDFTNKLIQRKAKNRLGYGGIDEILDHPWLKMSASERDLFRSKRQMPTFRPASNRNYDKIMQQSEPSQVQRQNILLLQQQSVQSMFKEYDYVKSYMIETKASSASLNNTLNDGKETKRKLMTQAFVRIQV